MSLVSLLSYILESLSLVLPIFFSGIVLIWLLNNNYLSWLYLPIDNGIKLRGKALFGSNKTWLGAAIYVLGTISVCILLSKLVWNYSNVVHPIFRSNPIKLGLVVSLAYVLGELTNSFVKRRLNILPGHVSGKKIQKIIDNVDGIVFVAAAVIVLYGLTANYLVIAGIIGIILHKLTDVYMVHLGIKQQQ